MGVWSNGNCRGRTKYQKKSANPGKIEFFEKLKEKTFFLKSYFFGNIKKIEIKSKKEFIKQREKNREKMIFFKKKQSKKKKRKIEKIEISRNNLPHRRHKNYFSTIYTVSQRKKRKKLKKSRNRGKVEEKSKKKNNREKNLGLPAFPGTQNLPVLLGPLAILGTACNSWNPCKSWDSLTRSPLPFLGPPAPEATWHIWDPAIPGIPLPFMGPPAISGALFAIPGTRCHS